MGFYSRNKHFIRQKLNLELRKVEDSKKADYYISNLQSDTRGRISKSFQGCTDKTLLYQDFLDYVGAYEPDLIFLNLLLEEGCCSIASSLSFRKNQKLPFQFQILHDLYNHFTSTDKITLDQYVDYLKDYTCELIDTNESVWRAESKNDNRLIRAFTDSISKDLINGNLNPNKYILLCIIWYQFKLFYNPFNNTKAIVLTNALNDSISKNQNSSQFTQTVIEFYKLSLELKSLIIDKIYIPYTDIIPPDCMDGLNIQTKQLINQIKLFVDREELPKYSFESIFLKFKEESESDFFVESLTNEVDNRFKNFQIPTQSELETLNEMRLENLDDIKIVEFAEKILVQCYKFEWL